ncbi:variable surface lipoprotein, partial [Mycoplasmopsis bovis]|uniref:variable surface lipoprotein n=1 Tax=Mycoplasmopsis bovis TaxID=28903 RepID=UPI003D283D92
KQWVQCFYIWCVSFWYITIEIFSASKHTRHIGNIFSISISSMPLIAASCENKNPTDESIINNIAPPKLKVI